MITKTAEALTSPPKLPLMAKLFMALAGGYALGAGLNRMPERFRRNDNNINPNRRYMRRY